MPHGWTRLGGPLCLTCAMFAASACGRTGFWYLGAEPDGGPSAGDARAGDALAGDSWGGDTQADGVPNRVGSIPNQECLAGFETIYSSPWGALFSTDEGTDSASMAALTLSLETYENLDEHPTHAWIYENLSVDPITLIFAPSEADSGVHWLVLWAIHENGLGAGYIFAVYVNTCAQVFTPGRTLIVGTAGDDVLNGTPGPDLICGLAGADTLSGLGGADILHGGTDLDNDILEGGDGDDILVPWYQDTLQGGAGNDTFWGFGGGGWYYLRGDFGPANSIEYLRGVDTLSLGGTSLDLTATQHTGYLEIRGTPANEVMIGTPGSEVFYSEGGNDLMRGEQGNDEYYLESLGAQVVEGSSGGYDRLNAQVSLTLPSEVEEFRTIAFNPAPITVYGNELDNWFLDNDWVNANTFFGGPGADYFMGTGLAIAYGEEGNDLFSFIGEQYGGPGSDHLMFDNSLCDGGEGTDLLSVFGGNIDVADPGIQGIEAITSEPLCDVNVSVADVLRVSDLGMLSIWNWSGTPAAGCDITAPEFVTRGADWVAGPSAGYLGQDGTTFGVFTSGGAELRVKLGLSLNGTPVE